MRRRRYGFLNDLDPANMPPPLTYRR